MINLYLFHIIEIYLLPFNQPGLCGLKMGRIDSKPKRKKKKTEIVYENALSKTENNLYLAIIPYCIYFQINYIYIIEER